MAAWLIILDILIASPLICFQEDISFSRTISLFARCDQTTYRIGEPIFLHIGYKNNTDEIMSYAHSTFPIEDKYLISVFNGDMKEVEKTAYGKKQLKKQSKKISIGSGINIKIPSREIFFSDTVLLTSLFDMSLPDNYTIHINNNNEIYTAKVNIMNECYCNSSKKNISFYEKLKSQLGKSNPEQKNNDE